MNPEITKRDKLQILYSLPIHPNLTTIDCHIPPKALNEKKGI